MIFFVKSWTICSLLDDKPHELCIDDQTQETFQSCGIAFKTPQIQPEYQCGSDIHAQIFLRKTYPCGRKDESNKLPFIFETPKLAIFDAEVPQQASPPSVNFPIQNPGNKQIIRIRV